MKHIAFLKTEHLKAKMVTKSYVLLWLQLHIHVQYKSKFTEPKMMKIVKQSYDEGKLTSNDPCYDEQDHKSIYFFSMFALRKLKYN